MHPQSLSSSFFFFNDTATTEIYTLSLHDALPISYRQHGGITTYCALLHEACPFRLKSNLEISTQTLFAVMFFSVWLNTDRKSTRLNSSHSQISYAVFCLKKKKHISHNNHLTQLQH